MLGVYMTVKEFANKKQLSEATVQRYCKKGMIIGAEKKAGVWVIPEDSIKPLTDKQTRQMLLSLLLLKNNIAARPDFTLAGCGDSDIPKFFEYLNNKKFIRGFNINDGNMIPINTCVSDAGIDFLFHSKDKTHWVEIILELGMQFIPLILRAIGS